MTPERWQQISDVLERALDLELGQRSVFLGQACSSDKLLRQEVEALLDSGPDAASTFLQAQPMTDGMLTTLHGVVSGGSLQSGQIFALRFRLIRKLGEGGMGQVWLAEQTSPVRRQVALKLIRAGMYDESVVQRFQSERQALAIMDHPAIAKVFDAGATTLGQPYFVMEYVPGLPITEYCDQKKLTIENRLELFIQACEGVQHAHQKAIIHRDLKPANILVVEMDGKPVPRIIDFGLAKATTPLVDGETIFTQLGHFVGTPGYMSPEQADPNLKDVDTRTDVYSLGVVLYELLAGSQPFDAKRGQEQPLDELIRRLREEEPPTPSNKVSSDRDTSSAAAEARGTEPRQLASLLRGDLDWITMKAMEKVRARRYGTPSELAADIRRYLDHEAIVARPASTGYRLRKYVRRHRVTVGVAAGLVMLLAAFSVLQAAQLRRTTRERDRANRITDFMTDMFKVSDPNEARGNSVTAREILDKASNDMGKGLAQDPEAQSLMMEVMARTYTNLGLYPRAYELAKNAFDSRTRLLGSDNPKTLESMTQLGWILSRQGHYPEAERLEREALARDRRILGPENPLTLETTDNMSSTREEQGHFDDVEKPEREVIEIATRTLGPESVSALRARGILGLALFNLGRYAEAEQEYRQLVDADRRVRGAEHPETLKAMDNLAVSLCVQGRLAEAEPMYRELLATERRVLGPDHPYTATAMGNLLGILSGEGQWAEAEKLAREAVAVETRVLGPEHNRTLLAKSNLADILSSEGHAHEAEQLEREALEVWTREHGPEDSSTLFAESVLAGILVRGGHYAEGEKIARKIFPVEMRTLWPQHPYTLDTLQHLGMALAYTHRYAEASQLFRDQIEKTNNSKGQGDQFTVWYDFACAAVAANRPDEALQYLREAINRGYKNADGLMTDPDLKSLRDNPKFQQLVAQLKLPPHGTP